LYAENKAVNLVQPLGSNEPYEPEFIIVSSGQESKLHPSIMKKSGIIEYYQKIKLFCYSN